MGAALCFSDAGLHGEVIGLEALEEREYRIWFGPLALGVFDSYQGVVRAAGNVQDLIKKVFRMYSDQNVQDVLRLTPDTAR